MLAGDRGTSGLAVGESKRGHLLGGLTGRTMRADVAARAQPMHAPGCWFLRPSYISSVAKLGEPSPQLFKSVNSSLQRPREEAFRSVKVAGARCALNLPTNLDLDTPLPGFSSIKDALSELTAGNFLVVLDDENRENEGDLIIAADNVTAADMAFMVEHTSGVICIGMEGADLDRLRLPLMVGSVENEESMYTAFTVTVDLREGISTGISAADRAATLRKLADPKAVAGEFRRPGHIFPLRARPGGVLARPGHTEASVDLGRLAGRFPAGALCEIVSKVDGSMARTPELLEFAKEHGLCCITIADLMRYRLRHEKLIEEALQPAPVITTRHGPVAAHVFRSTLDGAEHLALAVGDVKGRQGVLVQVQHESPIADVLGCAPLGLSSSAPSVDEALGRMVDSGRGGILVLLRTRPVTLAEQARHLAAGQGHSTLGANKKEEEEVLDLIDFGLATQMLKSLGVGSVTLTTECKMQKEALECCGLTVVGVFSGHHLSNGKSTSSQHAPRPLELSAQS